MSRVGIFVDAHNLFISLGVRFGGRKLDYAKYLAYVSLLGSVETANVYGIQQHKRAIGFIHALEKSGWICHDRTTAECVSWNVGLCMDVVRFVEQRPDVNVIVLGSSDGSLVPLLAYLAEKGVRTVILAAGVITDFATCANSCIEIPESLLEDRQ